MLGIDLSEKMLEQAALRNQDEKIRYRHCGIEAYEYPESAWDIVVSNLALHYIEDLEPVFRNVWRTLRPGGIFLFNIEHPVFLPAFIRTGSTGRMGPPNTGLWMIITGPVSG